MARAVLKESCSISRKLGLDESMRRYLCLLPVPAEQAVLKAFAVPAAERGEVGRCDSNATGMFDLLYKSNEQPERLSGALRKL
jgi:hypothetical protein